jgi:hypothetical protein
MSAWYAMVETSIFRNCPLLTGKDRYDNALAFLEEGEWLVRQDKHFVRNDVFTSSQILWVQLAREVNARDKEAVKRYFLKWIQDEQMRLKATIRANL